MTINELIAELEEMKEILGGDAPVYAEDYYTGHYDKINYAEADLEDESATITYGKR